MPCTDQQTPTDPHTVENDAREILRSFCTNGFRYMMSELRKEVCGDERLKIHRGKSIDGTASLKSSWEFR